MEREMTEEEILNVLRKEMIKSFELLKRGAISHNKYDEAATYRAMQQILSLADRGFKQYEVMKIAREIEGGYHLASEN